MAEAKRSRAAKTAQKDGNTAQRQAFKVVQEVLHTIRVLNQRGLTILLVEQNVALSLKISSRAYVLENGRVVMRGSGEQLLHDDRVRQAYLGL